MDNILKAFNFETVIFYCKKMEVSYSQGQNLRIDWESNDLPNAFKYFKLHAKFMFGGPSLTKSEKVKCNNLGIWAGEISRQIISTWTLEANDKSLKAITLAFRTTANHAQTRLRTLQVEVQSKIMVKSLNRAPVRSAYWKTIFFISHPKHMLWVLKRTVS